MSKARIAVAVLGAGALVGSVLTTAVASQPPGRHSDIRASRWYNLNGNYKVNGVLRVMKNNSVYGRLYAHGGQQVWQGLLIHSGGLKTDALEVTGNGPALFQSANVASNLQAGTITTSGNATIGGNVSATGKLLGNGVDAGSGGLTTGGSVTAGSITTAGAVSAASLTTTGNISAGSGNISTTGNINAGGLSVTGLTATGTVDLTRANVQLPSALNVGGNPAVLTVGSSAATVSPLTISENGKTATLGVSPSGALTANDLALGGNATIGGTLTVTGTGITAGSLTALNATSTTTPGPLTLTGNGITLAGNTTLNAGHDLLFSAGTGVASHVLANGDRDVAGTATVNVRSGAAEGAVISQEVTFAEPFSQLPVVTLTAAGDPEPGSNGVPKVWVTPIAGSGTPATYTGFTIHYAPYGSAITLSSFSVTYNYHVIGS